MDPTYTRVKIILPTFFNAGNMQARNFSSLETLEASGVEPLTFSVQRKMIADF